MSEWVKKVSWSKTMYGEVYFNKNDLLPVVAVLYKPDGSVGVVETFDNKEVENIE